MDLVRLGPWSVWGLGPSRALVRLGPCPSRALVGLEPWCVWGRGPSGALVRLAPRVARWAGGSPDPGPLTNRRFVSWPGEANLQIADLLVSPARANLQIVDL